MGRGPDRQAVTDNLHLVLWGRCVLQLRSKPLHGEALPAQGDARLLLRQGRPAKERAVKVLGACL